LFEGPGFHVEAATVDHGTPCLAFALVQDARFRFDTEALAREGPPPGPERLSLKRAIDSGEVSGEQAARLGAWVPGRRVAYLTDCVFSEANVRAAMALARGADVLYCEATFPDARAEHAARVMHLSGGQAGALARVAGVGHLVPFHFSRRHAKDAGPILADVARGRNEEGPWSVRIRAWLEGSPNEHALEIKGAGPPVEQRR
jgi:ribonuclease BN (tRNA processing enzyme)